MTRVRSWVSVPDDCAGVGCTPPAPPDGRTRVNRLIVAALAALTLVACRGPGKSDDATASALTPPAAQAPADSAKKGAPLFNNLGTYTRSVTTSSEEARK